MTFTTGTIPQSISVLEAQLAERLDDVLLGKARDVYDVLDTINDSLRVMNKHGLLTLRNPDIEFEDELPYIKHRVADSAMIMAFNRRVVRRTPIPRKRREPFDWEAGNSSTWERFGNLVIAQPLSSFLKNVHRPFRETARNLTQHIGEFLKVFTDVHIGDGTNGYKRSPLFKAWPHPTQFLVEHSLATANISEAAIALATIRSLEREGRFPEGYRVKGKDVHQIIRNLARTSRTVAGPLLRDHGLRQSVELADSTRSYVRHSGDLQPPPGVTTWNEPWKANEVFTVPEDGKNKGRLLIPLHLLPREVPEICPGAISRASMTLESGDTKTMSLVDAISRAVLSADNLSTDTVEHALERV